MGVGGGATATGDGGGALDEVAAAFFFAGFLAVAFFASMSMPVRLLHEACGRLSAVEGGV